MNLTQNIHKIVFLNADTVFFTGIAAVTKADFFLPNMDNLHLGAGFFNLCFGCFNQRVAITARYRRRRN